MQLHKLELHGFKSFADKTEFQFDPGITGLVGPNGCGKSNVVDCIKWALGTQSAKTMRGEEMLDVIFNGSSTRPASGFAEVSMTFTNEDRRLPIDYSEVTVTRRLYRSGESEYLLNRQGCRLKDIRELFLDTGIGVQSYSIIEQGKIDLLIQSSAKERRAVFEEAAGISKYKARRKEAEGKLDRVRQDLLRIGDILRELNREIRSLRIQAGRAARWVTLSRQWKEKRLALARIQYNALMAQRAETLGRIADLERLQAETQKRIRSLSEEVVLHEARLSELAARSSVVESARAAAEARARGLEDRERSETQRLAELAEEGRRLAHDEERAKEEIQAVTGRRAENAEQLRQVQEELARVTEDLAREEQLLVEFSRGCAELSTAIEAKKAEALEVVHRRAGYQNELTEVASDRRNLLGRRERVQQRSAEIAAELARIAEQGAAVRGELDRAQAGIRTLDERREAAEAAYEAATRELATRETAIQALREELAKKTSRRDLLMDLERHREGMGTAVKEVLARVQAGPTDGWEGGVRGLLADFLEVPTDAVAIVEAALGDRAELVICGRHEDALGVVSFARGLGKGRVSAMAPDVALLTATRHEGPRASDLIRCDASVAPVVEMLLGRFLVVETLHEALERLRACPSEGPWVTRAGELVEREGMISGGSQAGSAGIIGRRTELRTLTDEIAVIEASLADHVVARNAAATAKATHDADLKRLRTALYETNVVVLERKNEAEGLSKRETALRDEQEVNALDLSDIAKQIVLLDEREEGAKRVLAELAELHATIQAEIERSTQELAKAEERRQGMQHRVTDLKIARAKAAEGMDHLADAAERLAREEGLARERLAGLGRRGEELAERRARAQAALEEVAREIQTAREELGARERESGEILVAKDAAAGLLKDVRERSGALERELGARAGHVQELRLDESRQTANLENLRQRVRDDLGLDLEAPVTIEGADPNAAEIAALAAEAEEGAAPASGEQPPVAGEQSPAAGEPTVASEKPAEIEAPAAAPDPVALQAEIDELKRKLDAMGNVNMAALTELKERMGRLEVLSRQEKDLQEAMKELEELIRKLNRESRERFDATLALVRENFNSLFRKLFGGGKADLVLEDGVDVLETGIEIVAKPPGKELNSISLLSGGEKALTTLALVMSIFLLKPSPFCVLDEVDAPLDEKNIDRFLGMLQEFASETQFLVITHNKRTMAMTRILYGVTMQEPGVSRKISVKMVDEVDPLLASAPGSPNGYAR